jgi:two-component system, OmpR family, sensor histidine kinase CpxA
VTRRGSLASRTLAVAAINLLLLFVAAAVVVRWQLGQEFESFLLAAAGERVVTISRDLATELQGATPAAREELLGGLRRQHGLDFLLVGNDGTHIAGPEQPLPEPVVARLRGRGGPPPEPGRIPAAPPFLVTADSAPRYWVGVRIPIGASGQPPIPGTLLLVSNSFFGNRFFFDPRPWVALLIGAVILSAGCWLLWVRGITRDIAHIEQVTSRVAEGRFDVRLDVARDDEIGRLADSVSHMTGRLSDLIGAQKRFLSDAAHELRSPLARMQVAVDLVDDAGASASPRHLAALRDDVAEMSRIADALLQLGRAELGRATAQAPSPVAVAPAIARAVQREGRDTDTRVTVQADVTALALPDQLDRALGNLIRNAVFYAGSAGPIEVSASAADQRVRIVIADHGPGVPDAELPKLFTPFYRPDVSRQRGSGGTGLGLAIVRASIESCGGRVTCRNRAPHGLEVTIELPQAPAQFPQPA